MKPTRCLRVLLIAIAGILSGCGHVPVVQSLPAQFDQQAVLVVIDDPRPERRRHALPGPGYQSRRNYDVDPLLAKSATSIADSYGTVVEYQWPVESIDAHCFVVLTDDVATLVAQLNADSRVRYAQVVNEFRTRDNSLSRATRSQTDSAKKTASVSHARGQRIAIVDTRADLDHPDLPRERVAQWDLVGQERGMPKERHGTAVLGLLAATPMNGIGIDGAAPQANFGVFRGCWQLDEDSAAAACDSVSLSLALQTAHDWNPDVVNLSLTGPRDPLLEEIVGALLARGSVVVAAFDETRNEANRFPLSRPGVVYAYGISAADTQVADSHRVVTEVRDALTLQPDAEYNVLSGHSMAAPMVSARVAKFRVSMPNADIETLQDALRTARFIGTDN